MECGVVVEVHVGNGRREPTQVFELSPSNMKWSSGEDFARQEDVLVKELKLSRSTDMAFLPATIGEVLIMSLCTLRRSGRYQGIGD